MSSDDLPMPGEYATAVHHRTGLAWPLLITEVRYSDFYGLRRIGIDTESCGSPSAVLPPSPTLDRATLERWLDEETRVVAPSETRLELLRIALRSIDAAPVASPHLAGTRIRVRRQFGFGYTYGTVSAEPPPNAVRVDWDDATSSLIAAEHLEVAGDGA